MREVGDATTTEDVDEEEVAVEVKVDAGPTGASVFERSTRC